MTSLDSILKSRDTTFSNSHVWMWDLGQKEGWMPKNGCFQIAVLEQTLESPLDCKEIKPVNPKGNQSRIFIGRTDAVSWSCNTLATWCKELNRWKRPWFWERLKAGGEGDDRGQDDWMASLTQWTWVWAYSKRWDGQGSLVCCSPWGCKESDTS